MSFAYAALLCLRATQISLVVITLTTMNYYVNYETYTANYAQLTKKVNNRQNTTLPLCFSGSKISLSMK